ncbi:MAG: hypothetical protein ABJD97_10230 [Betaproteobacteria bacterium]
MMASLRTAARIAIAATGLLLSASALSGSVSGPYVLWMNFADNVSADEALHAYTHAEASADSCWNDSGLLLYREFAPAITPRLVQRAVLLREPAAQARLRALLRKGDPGLGGYDGVIVIPKSPKPTIVSFSAAGKIKSRPAIDRSGQAIWADAFCEVLPPISRKP